MNKKQKHNKYFRHPEDRECINYDCGCVYEVVYPNKTGTRWTIENNIFCEEHDPTLTEYGREHIEEAMEL